MPRPVWKGQVSFGLVSIPVVLYAAEHSRELSFNLVDRRNRARVRYERVNEATGKTVPYADIVKGYEYEDGQYVLLGDEDFRRAAVDASKTVEIQEFIGRHEIDPRYCERPYYLVPEKRGARAYVLLRETLARSERVGIAKVVIHTRQYMGAVYPYEDALVLVLLRFPSELHDLSEFEFPRGTEKEYKITRKEAEMADTLVESMAGTWAPAMFHDDYREALLKWIEEKARKGNLAPTSGGAGREKRERESGVVNIMELLRKSVGQSKKKGRGTPHVHAGAAPRRKRA